MVPVRGSTNLILQDAYSKSLFLIKWAIQKNKNETKNP